MTERPIPAPHEAGDAQPRAEQPADPARMLTAGLMMIVASAAVTVAGGLLGNALGYLGAGVIVGAILGFIAGFWLVFVIYLRPLRERMMRTDYSHLRSSWNDDD